LVTCKDFLSELNEYLDEECRGEVRKELEEHLNECPNCWVICDTTKKTIEIYRGLDAVPIPTGVHDRLLDALRKKSQSAPPA
jgi:predicted anti-sigma-YlaC factor YlaD